MRQPLAAAILACISATLANAAAATDTPPSSCRQAIPSEVTALLNRWQTAVGTGDADAIAEFYAESAVLFPAMGENPRQGRAAIRSYFAEFAGRHPLPTVTMRSVMAGCGMATEMGTARFQVTGTRKGTRMFVGGRYSTVLMETNGRWLIAQQSLSMMPQLNRASPLAR